MRFCWNLCSFIHKLYFLIRFAPIPSGVPISYGPDHGQGQVELPNHFSGPFVHNQPHHVHVHSHGEELSGLSHPPQHLEEYQGPQIDGLEYAEGPQEQGPAEYVAQSGAFGYDHQSPVGVSVSDPYSDYSRLSAHYSTVKGDPVSVSNRRRGGMKDEKWKPILSKISNSKITTNSKKLGKRELDESQSNSGI